MQFGRMSAAPRALSPIEAVAAAAAVSVIVTHLLAAAWPVFDTVGQLSRQALCLCGLTLLWSLAHRRWGAAATLGVLCIWLSFDLWPETSSPPQPPAQGRRLQVYFNNIWTENTNGAAIERSIQTSNADIVTLVQVTNKNLAFVQRALAKYPYQAWAKRVSNRSGRTVVASRFPLTYEEPSCDASNLPPGFEVAVQAPAPVRLIVAHLPRPWPFRSDQLREYGRLAKQVNAGGATDRTLVVGDFNATLSSTVERRLARDTGLHALPAIMGDWPSIVPPILRMPIENVLAGKALAVGKRRLAALSGSDHQPIAFEASPSTDAARKSLPASAGRPACFL